MASEIEWRRSWKRDLLSTPWRPVNCEKSDDQHSYMMKAHFTEDSYELILTDFTCMWHESLDVDGIQKRTKSLNPSVEAPVKKLLSHIREQVEGSEPLKCTVSFQDRAEQENPDVCLTVRSRLAGLPFTWKFHGKPTSCDQFSAHMTQPLLMMVGELCRREQELFKILSKKDKELDDHKSQGSKVTRKHLETAVFNETAFVNDMEVSKGFEEVVKQGEKPTFAPTSQDLYEKLMMKRSWLNRKPEEGMEYESLEDDGSVLATGNQSGESWEAARLPASLIKPGSASPQKSSRVESPSKTTSKSPRGKTTPESSPVKDSEQQRREALQRRLAEEEARMEEKSQKKKKKLKI